MPITRTYECPDCGARKTVLHLSRSEPPPLCPHCDQEGVAQPSAPHIAKSIGKVADNVYRQMEEGAASRAAACAEAFGESPAETALGLTDLRDNQRAGDVAAIPPGTVPANLPQGPGVSAGPRNFSDPTAAAEYARNAHTGPIPYAGATSPHGWSAVRANHHATAAAVTARGSQGRG